MNPCGQNMQRRIYTGGHARVCALQLVGHGVAKRAWPLVSHMCILMVAQLQVYPRSPSSDSCSTSIKKITEQGRVFKIQVRMFA